MGLNLRKLRGKMYLRDNEDDLQNASPLKAGLKTPTQEETVNNAYTGPTYTVEELKAMYAEPSQPNNNMDRMNRLLGIYNNYGGNKNNTVPTMINAYGSNKFTYDPEKDANYQAYLKLARENGQLAMEDTLAKASAMTGGYSNSNAQIAGQKVYNQHLSEAEANMGNYYAMALDAFNNDQDTLLNQINLAWAAEDRNIAAADRANQNAITDAQLKAEYGDYSGLLDLGVSADAINKYKETADWGSKYAQESAELEKAITIAQATGDYTALYKLLNYTDEQIANINTSNADAEYESRDWVDKDYDVNEKDFHLLGQEANRTGIPVEILLYGSSNDSDLDWISNMVLLTDSRTGQKYTVKEVVKELEKAKYTQNDILEFFKSIINNS